MTDDREPDMPVYADVLRVRVERLGTIDLGAVADRLEALLDARENAEKPASRVGDDEDRETLVVLKHDW